MKLPIIFTGIILSFFASSLQWFAAEATGSLSTGSEASGSLSTGSETGTGGLTGTVRETIYAWWWSAWSSSSSSVPSFPVPTLPFAKDPTTTPTSTNPNITQDLFKVSVTTFRSIRVIKSTTTLPFKTILIVYRVLPNGKFVKVWTTRVLKNGRILYVTRSPGTYKFIQK